MEVFRFFVELVVFRHGVVWAEDGKGVALWESIRYLQMAQYE